MRASWAWLKSHHQKLFPLLFIGCVLLCAYFFYLRFPNNFLQPNFYGEDGRDYTANIINKGFLSAAFTTFNGYYIWGLYLLSETAMLGNQLLGGSFVTVPQSLAVVSYLFLGFCASLPLLLFRKQLRPVYLMALIAACCIDPMKTSDYAIIGTIGNLKWLFTYVAFLLVVYRCMHWRTAKLTQVMAIDLGILICAYTNATAYLVAPFMLMPYLAAWWKHKSAWRELILTPSFISLATLIVLLIPQIIVVAINGIPPMPGYLDTPFRMSRFTEIFIGRTFLFGLIFPIYHHLDDTRAVALALMLGGSLWFFGGKKYRLIYLFGLLTALLATTLFVLNRTGIGEHFLGYLTGGPDQFFYVQSLIMYFVFFLALSQFSLKLNRWVALGLPVAVILVYSFYGDRAGTWGQNNFMAAGVGVFTDNALVACSRPSDPVRVQIYPVPVSTWQIQVPRDDVCPNLNNYQPTTDKLGLIPHENDHVPLLATGTFKQTFTATRGNLDGLSLFLATFGAKHLKTPYTLTIYASDCRTPLRSTSIDLRTVADNARTLIPFAPLANSSGKQYCFELSPRKAPKTPLAIRLSQPGSYTAGELTVGDQASDADAVFDIHYSAKKSN